MGRIVTKGQLVLRWFTRLFSLATVFVLLPFLLDDFDAGKIRPAEWVSLFFFPLGLVLGLAIGWFREGLGGLVASASLLCFYAVSLLTTARFPGLAFVVFLLPALLFLACWLARPKLARS